MRRPNVGWKSGLWVTMVLASLGVGQGGCLSSNGGADASIVDSRPSADKATTHRDSSLAIDLPPIGNCEPFTNLGCGAASKCTALQQPDGTLAMGCDAVGSKVEGDACTQVMISSGLTTVQVDDDCADGLACFSVQAGTPATCHRMCYSDGSRGCPSGETCLLAAPGLGLVEFCRPTESCSPIDQTGCTTGRACYWSSSGALCATVGTGKVGEPCVNANDCVPGASCLALSPNRCVSFCRAVGTSGCPDGSTCSSISSGASAASVGYCK